MTQLALPMAGLRGARSYEIKDWNPLERSFRVVASTAQPVRNVEEGPDGKPVEFWESLASWDLSRFAKNNLVFRAHRTDNEEDVIGTASEPEEGPDGLSFKVTLASLYANPTTAATEARLKEGLLRGVSVGWDYGQRSDETIGGKLVRVYRNNVLNEFSLVPLPKDDAALVERDERTDQDKRRDALSTAGRQLSQGRMRDSGDQDVQLFDTGGQLGRPQRIAAGGLRVPSRLTRTGVLVYKKDGETIRQLRHPDDVFDAASLETLRSAPLTDRRFHNGFIDPSTWKERSLGHVESPRRDGNFIAGDVIINDGATLADAENGRARDLSPGYRARLEWGAGVYDGEPYDCRQRDIRYNHVAVLPPGAGRSGTDVALLMDAAGVEFIEQEESPMAEPQTITKTIINFDGHDYEYGSKDHLGAVTKFYDAKILVLDAKVKEAVENFDKASGKAEAAARALEEEKKGRAADAGGDRKRMKARMKLIRAVAKLFESNDDEDDDKDEEKMDSLFDMNERQLMEEVIKADESYGEKFITDSKDRSDGFIEGVFEGITKRGLKRADGVDSVVRAHRLAEQFDAKDSREGGNSPVSKARENVAKRESFEKKRFGYGANGSTT
jgi:uncharacterized protein